MIYPLSLSQHTLYADLLEQGWDDLFDLDWPENGSLLIRLNRAGTHADHAYYQGYRPAAGDTDRGQRYARYLGRADDPEVAATIARFRRVKAVRAERTTTVRALIGAGMPRPDRITGRIIEALARAGLFPDNAVLIGGAACQTYAGVLGVRFGKAQKAVFSARRRVDIVVPDGCRSADILAALRGVDPSFSVMPEAAGSYRSANAVYVSVTVLDPADDETVSLISFLIAKPVRAIVLHGPGIPVTVPAPERFAVCTWVEREAYAGPLFEALSIAGRQHDLARAIATVMKSELISNTRLEEGLSHLRPDLVAAIKTPM